MSGIPVTFHLGIADWAPAEALAGLAAPGTHYFLSTPWNWILQTFHHLRARGREIELTSAMPDSGIIVLCSGTLPVGYVPSPRQFFISVNADEAPDQFTQMCITQNSAQTRFIPDSYDVPHWPQPGLIARAPTRGDIFASAAYFGDDANLEPQLGAGQWATFLAQRGIAWQVRNAFSGSNTDFSDIDCAVAVRSFRSGGFIRKPASKLFNAWIAGVPAILGRELALQEQRRSALDYIEVASFEEACAAIDRLAGSPDLRRAMAENGRRRSLEVSIERIADRWEHLLYDVAPEAARRWQAQSNAGRRAFLLRRRLHKKARGAAHRLLRGVGREQWAL
jgi:hypothetical protein